MEDSLARRAAIAAALLVGFYPLALATAGGLLFIDRLGSGGPAPAAPGGARRG